MVTVGLFTGHPITYVFTFVLFSIAVPIGELSSHNAAEIISFSVFTNSSLVQESFPALQTSARWLSQNQRRNNDQRHKR